MFNFTYNVGQDEVVKTSNNVKLAEDKKKTSLDFKHLLIINPLMTLLRITLFQQSLSSYQDLTNDKIKFLVTLKTRFR